MLQLNENRLLISLIIAYPLHSGHATDAYRMALSVCSFAHVLGFNQRTEGRISIKFVMIITTLDATSVTFPNFLRMSKKCEDGMNFDVRVTKVPARKLGNHSNQKKKR
jgi:hypothetical protein